ncbi:MAG TPA: hypothetical protein VGY58_11170 [Gemmataceae bacterium]|nr:hypothetical protein [Gemmataceae bacterium]
MGYALIWIESLAAALLLVALVTAWSAWRSRRLWQWAGPILLGLVLIALPAILTYGIGWLRYVRGMELPWFSYLLVWTIAFAVGALVVLVAGLRRRGEAGPAARFWSVSKLALTAAGLVLLTWITFSNMDLAVKIQLSAMRAEAGAKMLAAIPPRPPDRDNAAFVYQEAFAALASPDKVPQRWRPTEHGIFDVAELTVDPKDRELREFLATQQRGLELLRKAAAMPSCSFDHDYFLWADMPLSELPNLRQGVYLLAMDALARAGREDSPGALDDVTAMYGIARHINDPTLISLLIAAAIEKAALKTLEGVLSAAPPKPDGVLTLPSDDHLSYRRFLSRACRFEEMGLGVSYYTTLAAGDGSHVVLRDVDHAAGAIVETGLYRLFFLQDDLAAYRRTMQQIEELAGRPYYEAAKAWQDFDRTLRTRPPGILAMLLTPAFGRCSAVASAADAARGLARVALAMTAYRAQNGKYPEKLDQLIGAHLPAIPKDPFDGQPLRMKRQGQDIVLYSIGDDLKDDGGIPFDPATGQGDIVFHLRAP